MVSTDPDTMYFHKAMREPAKDKFIEAMQREIQDHEMNGHWEIVSKAEVSLDTKILEMVWAMKRKRHRYLASVQMEGTSKCTSGTARTWH